MMRCITRTGSAVGEISRHTMQESRTVSKIGHLRRAFRGLGRAGRTPLAGLLERQLDETLAACELARSLAKGKTPSGEARTQVSEIEHRGDELRAELVKTLATAPVTPMEREDIFRLSRSIDDVLDNLRDFVREWDLYEVEHSESFLDVLAAIAAGVGSLREAVRIMPGDPKGTGRSALASKRSANEIRRAYDAEVGCLFDGELTMDVLKRRELLRRLDVVGLRLNEAVDVLSDATVKRRP
jgi:uncharacterized protein